LIVLAGWQLAAEHLGMVVRKRYFSRATKVHYKGAQILDWSEVFQMDDFCQPIAAAGWRTAQRGGDAVVRCRINWRLEKWRSARSWRR
jgi:hypothetical protein